MTVAVATGEGEDCGNEGAEVHVDLPILVESGWINPVGGIALYDSQCIRGMDVWKAFW